MALTVEQVLSLAPDPSAVQAADQLAVRTRWTATGASDDALWGACRGSSGVYEVRVAQSDLAAKCSCPSRRRPCKHALALMLLAAREPDAFPPAEPPEWVREWLATRAAAAERKRTKKPDQIADPEAQARRAEQRMGRVLDGLDLLDRWLDDVVREGLASLEERPHAFFETMAARLVDAQAPGLARRVRWVAGLIGSGPSWPERALDELGMLALASHAFRRLDQLPAALQADLRQQIGFTLEKPDVVAAGDLVPDDWFVLGQSVSEDERFRSQRSWLHGLRTGRVALVLQFAAGMAAFPEPIAAGTTLDATLAFWPGASPQRALLYERRGVKTGLPAEAGWPRIAGLLGDYADRVARLPWLDREGAVLRSVTPLAEADGFRLRDADGAALALAGSEHWKLLALSGGTPVDVCGEWNGRTFLPLGAIAGGEYHALRGEA